MHEKLKFSFGHILAFLSLIFWGYVTFVGVAYYTEGDYMIGGGVAASIILVLLLLLFRLQLLKSVNENFDRYIIRERVILIVFTLVCCVAFIPFSHFWTVKSNEEEIYKGFKQSLQTSRLLFADYQDYASERLMNLDKNIRAKKTSFNKDTIPYHVVSKGLRLQLLPNKYQNLQEDALEWIEQSEKTISIWNVFLIGNVDAIIESMRTWHSGMRNMSKHIVNDEPQGVIVFERMEMINEAINNLQSVFPLYTTLEFPKPLAWMLGLISMSLFYMPWSIQRRSPKSLVTIYGKRKFNYDEVHAQQLQEFKKITYEHKGLHLENSEQVQVNHHRQKLERNLQKTSIGHRALTLDNKPQNDNL